MGWAAGNTHSTRKWNAGTEPGVSLANTEEDPPALRHSQTFLSCSSPFLAMIQPWWIPLQAVSCTRRMKKMHPETLDFFFSFFPFLLPVNFFAKPAGRGSRNVCECLMETHCALQAGQALPNMVLADGLHF